MVRPEVWPAGQDEDGQLGTKRQKPEDVVAKLRQADVLIAQGQSLADVIRALGVTEVTYYRWRKEFGGLKTDQVRRMKDLELENQRLRKAVADLTLDKLILQEAARETSELRAPACVCRAHRRDDEGVRAPGLPGARAASLILSLSKDRRSARCRGAETTRPR